MTARRFEDLPILMLVSGDDVSLDRAFAAGATDIVIKPIAPVELTHRVRRVLHHRRELEDLRQTAARLEWTQATAKIGHWACDADSGRLRISADAAKRMGLPRAGMPLDRFLAETDILAVLLPLTRETRGILNRDLLRKLSRSGRSPLLPGPVLINAGRGGLQVDADVVAALDAGDIYGASLDVFETEPLPATSPLWQHPRVVITPHNAAESDPAAIVRYTLRQIAAHRSGAALENVVDRNREY